MTDKPPVSVVTPVYNGEAHLRACVESVLAQTYTNWDYTIADNRSTDRTLEIAREYAARDPRIRVWTAPAHVPVQQSYNNAVRQTSPASKYCKVVAADDWLAPECLEKMVALAEQQPTVAIVGAYGLTGTRVEWQGLPYSATVVNGRALCRERLLGGPYIFGTATSLLYRADIVRSRQSFFNDENLHCDSEACLEFLEKHDFGFVHQVLTFLGVRDDSLTSMSQRLQTYLPWVLLELVKYGPLYLTPEEMDSRIRQHLRQYYRYLGEQVFARRDRAFWNYHREELAELGYPLSFSRLAANSASHLLEFANPKHLIKGVVFPFRRLLATASR